MIRAVPGGVELTLQIQPRAKRTEVVGAHGDALKLRLAAPPVDGAANEALVRFLAERLEVARSAVSILSGATARRKRVRVARVTAEFVHERLTP